LNASPQHSGFFDDIAAAAQDGTLGVAAAKNPPNPISSTPTSTAANVNTDSEGIGAHNETTIAVNPTNPLNMIGSANDYQFFLTPGGQVLRTTYSRAHVTFDGGKSWTTYPISYNGYDATGDPAVSFDANGTAYLATLGFVRSLRRGSGPFDTAPDVLVAHSTDGGKTWSTPARVASGTGNSTSVGTDNDKEYITAWGNGNAIVTWTVFNQGPHGSPISSPIYASVTHDGGQTWTQGVQISGSFVQDQFSVPTVTADGSSIYVAFESGDASFVNTTGGNQYMVVKVRPSDGKPLGNPVMVADLYDSFVNPTDYPINVDGRQTYQDSQFRTNSAGNITADPTNSQHLAVVWSDMRNSTLPALADPYSAKTNSDIIVSQSFDGGVTWSPPTAIQAPGDQFMPWGAYDASGKLQIGYFDRSYDPANHQYGYTLASETAPGSLHFTTQELTTALSDPTKGDVWFPVSPNPDFPNATRFLGDYSGIAIKPSGVAALWTDKRLTVTFNGVTGSGQDAFFGDPSPADGQGNLVPSDSDLIRIAVLDSGIWDVSSPSSRRRPGQTGL
jgi:hypothetical protein